MAVQSKIRVSKQKKVLIGLGSLLTIFFVTLSILYFPRTFSGIIPKEQINSIYISDSVNEEKIMIGTQYFDDLLDSLREIKYVPAYAASKTASTYTFVIEYANYRVSINRSYYVSIKNKIHYINVVEDSLYELYLSFTYEEA